MPRSEDSVLPAPLMDTDEALAETPSCPGRNTLPAPLLVVVEAPPIQHAQVGSLRTPCATDGWERLIRSGQSLPRVV